VLGPAGFSVLRVATARQAIEQVGTLRPDVLLIHATLRDLGGIELCQLLRESQQIDAATPVIITTLGPCTREERLSALRAGAWECYGLPLDPEALLLKLRVYASAKLDADRAREDGLVDPATGLYNLPGILRRITELGTSAARYGWAFSCAALAPDLPADPADLDEATLRATIDAIVKVLTSVARRSDVVGRMSRTEFLVLAPQTDLAGASELARRLLAAIPAPEGAEGVPLYPVRVGCHGVANFAQAGIQPIEMIVRASLALRQAQEAPSERIRCYEPPTPPPAGEAQ
jgi:PleD family two-component response regulator